MKVWFQKSDAIRQLDAALDAAEVRIAEAETRIQDLEVEFQNLVRLASLYGNQIRELKRGKQDKA